MPPFGFFCLISICSVSSSLSKSLPVDWYILKPYLTEGHFESWKTQPPKGPLLGLFPYLPLFLLLCLLLILVSNAV